MATEKRKSKGKKRRTTLNVTSGMAHIQATFNNTVVSITDNQGNVVLAEGEALRQVDLDCFANAEGAPCADGVGMYWWNQNVIAELP